MEIRLLFIQFSWMVFEELEWDTPRARVVIKDDSSDPHGVEPFCIQGCPFVLLGPWKLTHKAVFTEGQRRILGWRPLSGP